MKLLNRPSKNPNRKSDPKKKIQIKFQNLSIFSPQKREYETRYSFLKIYDFCICTKFHTQKRKKRKKKG
jgi:hypothetical protein